MFGPYFRLRQDIWFLEVVSTLPKVVTANTKSSRLDNILAFSRIWLLKVVNRFPKVVTTNTKSSHLDHILAFSRILGFWRLSPGFQKRSQQTLNLNVWTIFWPSAGYLVFGGCQQASKSGHSKH